MSVHAHLGVFQTAERLFGLQERLEYFLLVWDGNVRTDRVEILQEEMTRLGDDILDLAQTLNWENFRVHAAAMANALRACRIAVRLWIDGLGLRRRGCSSGMDQFRPPPPFRSRSIDGNSAARFSNSTDSGAQTQSSAPPSAVL